MKHKVGINPLGRSSAHRKAMTRNMITSFFRYERIRTTKAKALAVRRAAEKMITRARLDSVHNRRMIARDITDKAILAKLFTDIAPRYLERPGGYTRVLKLGPRPSDAAEMVILELVGDDVVGTDKGATKKASDKTKDSGPKSAAKAPAKSAAKAKAGKVGADGAKPKAKAEPKAKTEPVATTAKPAAEPAASTEDSSVVADSAATPSEPAVDASKD